MSATDLRRRIIRVIALCIALIMLFTGNALATEGDSTDASSHEASSAAREGASGVEESSVEESTTDDTLQKMQEEYSALEKDIAANEKKLQEVQSSMSDQKNVVKTIYDKIDDTQNQINLLSTRVNLLNTDIGNTNKQIEIITGQIGSLGKKIEATQQAIEDKNTELKETYELLKSRLRAMYMAGNGSTIEFLLTSEDFSTLLTRAEMIKRVAEHDNDVMKTIESDVKQLESLNTTLEQSKEEQQNKKTDLDSKHLSLTQKKEDVQTASSMLKDKKAQIQVQYNEAQGELNQMDKTSKEYIDTIKKQEDQLIALSAEMEEYIRKNGSTVGEVPEKPDDTEKEDGNKKNPYVDENTVVFSSGMIFPLKHSGVYISSKYGMRTHPVTGEYKLHTGTDFTAGGINQKQIYAVKDGKVILAQPQGGYGNFIIIDHGNGVSTCYAHCDSIAVAAGDMVLQGQPIGRVGTTGYSTGPHLHFEVRINGKTTDPMNGYLKMPGK